MNSSDRFSLPSVVFSHSICGATDTDWFDKPIIINPRRNGTCESYSTSLIISKLANQASSFRCYRPDALVMIHFIVLIKPFCSCLFTASVER